ADGGEYAADVEHLVAGRVLRAGGRGARLDAAHRRLDGGAGRDVDRRHPVVVLVAEGLQRVRGKRPAAEGDGEQALVALEVGQQEVGDVEDPALGHDVRLDTRPARVRDDVDGGRALLPAAGAGAGGLLPGHLLR